MGLSSFSLDNLTRGLALTIPADGKHIQGPAPVSLSITHNIAIAVIVSMLGAITRRSVSSPTFWNLLEHLGPYRVRALATALVMAVGCLAYFFKKWQQYYYGFTELCFAAVSTWNIASGLSTHHEALVSRWTALIGATYVAARGLGNMSEAKAKTDQKSREMAVATEGELTT